MWVELWVGVLGSIPSNLLKRMAGTTGLEPAASAVTGQQQRVSHWNQTVSAGTVWYGKTS